MSKSRQENSENRRKCHFNAPFSVVIDELDNRVGFIASRRKEIGSEGWKEEKVVGNCAYT